MTQAGVILGPERRRRWSEAQRSALMARAFAPGAKVAEVAREADVCTSLLYRWRQAHLTMQGARTIGFAPAVLVEPGTLGRTVEAAAASAVTVALPGGVQVKVDATAPAELVTAILRALR